MRRVENNSRTPYQPLTTSTNNDRENIRVTNRFYLNNTQLQRQGSFNNRVSAATNQADTLTTNPGPRTKERSRIKRAKIVIGSALNRDHTNELITPPLRTLVQTHSLLNRNLSSNMINRRRLNSTIAGNEAQTELAQVMERRRHNSSESTISSSTISHNDQVQDQENPSFITRQINNRITLGYSRPFVDSNIQANGNFVRRRFPLSNENANEPSRIRRTAQQRVIRLAGNLQLDNNDTNNTEQLNQNTTNTTTGRIPLPFQRAPLNVRRIRVNRNIVRNDNSSRNNISNNGNERVIVTQNNQTINQQNQQQTPSLRQVNFINPTIVQTNPLPRQVSSINPQIIQSNPSSRQINPPTNMQRNTSPQQASLNNQSSPQQASPTNQSSPQQASLNTQSSPQQASPNNQSSPQQDSTNDQSSPQHARVVVQRRLVRYRIVGGEDIEDSEDLPQEERDRRMARRIQAIEYYRAREEERAQANLQNAPINVREVQTVRTRLVLPNNRSIVLNISNPEDMTYEQLLQLGNLIGNVKKGFSDSEIANMVLKDFDAMKHLNDQCPVCYTKFSGKKVFVLPCHHVYDECIQIWFKDSMTCPVCVKECKATDLTAQPKMSK